MTDKRPKQLVEHIQTCIHENDLALSVALDLLEAEVLRGQAKATMTNLRKHCTLSEGAIRSRSWAILRLKSIKQITKGLKKTVRKEPNGKTEAQLLREQIKGLLAENALLFEEIIGLHELISRHEREKEALSRRLQIMTNNKARG